MTAIITLLGQGICVHWEKYRARKRKMPLRSASGVPRSCSGQKLAYDNRRLPSPAAGEAPFGNVRRELCR